MAPTASSAGIATRSLQTCRSVTMSRLYSSLNASSACAQSDATAVLMPSVPPRSGIGDVKLIAPGACCR